MRCGVTAAAEARRSLGRGPIRGMVGHDLPSGGKRDGAGGLTLSGSGDERDLTRPRPGIAAVARAAGVSPTTVSHAFSGTRTVAPETRERVLRAAAILGYAPNRVARGLRLRRTEVIGLASDRIATTPFAGRIIEGAQDVAREHGLLLVVADSGGDREHESRLLRSFVDQRVDGILLARMFHQAVAEPHDVAGVPVVLVDAVPEPGWRVPAMVRWPGKIEPGTVSNEIVHHMDWFPTFLAAAGRSDIKEELKKGGVRAIGRRMVQRA